MTDFRIRVIVDPARAVEGSRRVRRELTGIGDAATRVQRLIRQAFIFGGTGLGLRELARAADTVTNLENRLKLVTAAGGGLEQQMRSLFNVANRTRASFESTGIIYSRVGLSAKELGTSQAQLLRFTESLNQAVILSGATVREAQFAIIQLAQGLASGALRGDELRSVLEQLPAVADVIAESLGVTRGQLRLLGSEGKISAEVVLRAFEEAGPRLAATFAETTPTIGQAFIVLQNQAIRLVAALDDSLGGASGAFAEGVIAIGSALQLLAENADVVATALTALAAVFAVRFLAGFATAVATAVGQMIALEIALGATTVRAAAASIAIKALQRALLLLAANPLVAIAAGLGIVLTLLSSSASASERLVDITGDLEQQVSSLQEAYDRADGSLSRLKNNTEDLTETEALNTQTEAVDALNDALNVLAVRIGGLALSEVTQGQRQELLQFAQAIRAGEADLQRLEQLLDEIGANDEASARLRDVVEQLIDSTREAGQFQAAADKAEAQVRVLAGTASDADLALLGLGSSMRGAATEADFLAESADGAVTSLRKLQEFIPELDRAARVQENLRSAQDALNEGLAEIQRGRRAGALSAADEVAETQRLVETYERARREITGVAEAQRDAAEALAEYTDEAGLGVLGDQARQVEEARREYEALVKQLEDTGAPVSDLAAAATAFEQTLRAIEAPELERVAEQQERAASALADYVSDSNINALEGQARSVAQARVEYEALREQLVAAGASQSQLNEAAAAFERELENIDRQARRGGVSQVAREAERAADALETYVQRARLANLEGRDQAIAAASLEYEALAEQLRAAGASQEQLNDAFLAFQSIVGVINDAFDRRQGSEPSFDNAIRDLELEGQLIRLNSDERERELRILAIQENLRRRGIDLSETEIGVIREKIAQNQNLEQSLQFVGDVASTVFGGIDDAVADFIRTGKFSFKDFASSVVADLARIATQALVIRPLLNGITGLFGGGGFSFNPLNLGSLFGGGSAATAPVAAAGPFQFGGSIVAGGAGGPDSQLFVSRISPGERVDFTPAGEGSPRRGESATINFNITTPDVEGFRKSQSQLAAQATRMLNRGQRNI